MGGPDCMGVSGSSSSSYSSPTFPGRADTHYRRVESKGNEHRTKQVYVQGRGDGRWYEKVR